MENNDLNKRVLQRLEEKIAIEEFRKKENIKKPNYLLKVASFFIATVIITGNVYTYATYEKDLFSYLLEKIGISEENFVGIDQTEENNETKLTLGNYGIDEDTLMVTYKLKLNKPIDYFVEYLISETTIINVDNIQELEDKKEIFYKISDTEYEIIQMYKIDENKLSDRSKLKSNLKLYKEYDGQTEELISQWNFEIDIEKSKFDMNYKSYTVENKKAIFEDVKIIENKNTDIIPEVELIEIKESDLATKLVLNMEKYFTDVDYFVEVEDNKGNKILDDGVQSILGGPNNEIIVRKLDYNSKIRINVYEKSHENEVLSKASIIVDLSKDLNSES